MTGTTRKLIPGQYSKGDRLNYERFMDLSVGSVVWAQDHKAVKFSGPLLVIGKPDEKSVILLDGEKVGCCIEFPEVVENDSDVAAFTPIGQLEFYVASPVVAGKT